MKVPNPWRARLVPRPGNRKRAAKLPTRDLIQWALKSCSVDRRQGVEDLVFAVEETADRGAQREAAVLLAQCLANGTPGLASADAEGDSLRAAMGLVGAWVETGEPSYAEMLWDEAVAAGDGFADEVILSLVVYCGNGAGLSLDEALQVVRRVAAP